MASLERLQSKIEELRRKIAEQEVRDERISWLAGKIREMDLTRADINAAWRLIEEGGGVVGGPKRDRRHGPKGRRPQRYRHPENPELTWSGWARKPRWVKEWLSNGHKLSDLEIQKGSSAS